jgi:transposase
MLVSLPGWRICRIGSRSCCRTRCSTSCSPVADLFGVKGRAWLAQLQLPLEESETVSAAMRQIEFLEKEIAEVERLIAGAAMKSAEIRRLMSVPGVNVIVAASFMGDDRRHSPLPESAQARWLPWP